MHPQDQTTNADHPKVVGSAPVPAQPVDREEADRDGEAKLHDEQGYDADRRNGEHATDAAGEDMDASDESAAAAEVADHDGHAGHAGQGDAGHDGPTRDGAAADGDEEEVTEPAPQPTAFGAATVGGAAAAAAMAGHGRAGQHDVRDEETARPGDGSLEDRPGVTGVPGDVPSDPVTALFSAEIAQRFRDRWRDVQLRFVDHPRAAAGEAQELVEEAMEALAAALAEQKSNLAGWNSDNAHDTEQLRLVVRRYRDFLDRVLGL